MHSPLGVVHYHFPERGVILFRDRISGVVVLVYESGDGNLWSIGARIVVEVIVPLPVGVVIGTLRIHLINIDVVLNLLILKVSHELVHIHGLSFVNTQDDIAVYIHEIIIVRPVAGTLLGIIVA